MSPPNRGGGAYFFRSALLSDVTFIGNTSGNNGAAGGGAYFDAAAIIRNSTFSGNVAKAAGGGAVFGGVDAKFILNSRFTRNSAEKGAAIFVNPITAHPLDIVYTTIASPTVVDGHAIYVQTGTVNITNTIIVSHTYGIYQVGGTVKENHNLFFSNPSGALFGGIISGGQSFIGNPHFVNPGADDYHLGTDSVALEIATDVGINDDFDGSARPLGNGFDTGAYESSLPAPLPTLTPTNTPTLTSTPTGTPKPNGGGIYLPIATK